MTDKRFHSVSLVLPELVRTTSVLDGYVFYRCRIAGPSVLIIGDGCIFANNFSTGRPDNLFWTIPDDQKDTVGAVTALNCVFEECYLHRIGFAQTSLGLEKIKATLAYVEQYPPPQTSQ